jgi:hypothetical protein
MNKKTLFILLATLVVIIILILLGLKSCTPRVKEQPIADATAAEQAKINVERNNFINANTEFACELIKNPALKDDETAKKTGVRDTFKKHNLPVEDNASMIALLKRYEGDTEITTIVKENIKPCLQGQDPIFVQ